MWELREHFAFQKCHAPADKKFAGALADKIIPAFMVKGSQSTVRSRNLGIE